MFCFVVVLSNPFPEQLSMLGPELCLDQKTVQVHMNTKVRGRRLFWLAVSPCPAWPGVSCTVSSSGLGLCTWLRGGSAHPAAAGQWCLGPAGRCVQRPTVGSCATFPGEEAAWPHDCGLRVLFTLPNQDESYILN